MKNVIRGTVAGSLLAVAALAFATAPDVTIRSSRTVVAATQGLGSAQVCVVACEDPNLTLACEPTDPDVANQEVIFDVTALMVPGTPACFRAVALSAEGIESVPSENSARGTVPAPPVLR